MPKPAQNQPTSPTSVPIKMSTATNIIAAKRALLAKMQKELEELECTEEQRKREEAEAKHREEEKRKREAEVAEEARKKEVEVFTQKEREVLKERKRQYEAERKKKEMEAGKSQKRGSEESTTEEIIGVILVDDGVVWKMKEGRVCASCADAERRCHWRDDNSRARSCYHCKFAKKTCAVVGEAGLSKRKKVEGKGKQKEKEKEKVAEESELDTDSGAALLAEMQGLREEVDGLRTEFRAMAEVGRAIVKLL